MTTFAPKIRHVSKYVYINPAFEILEKDPGKNWPDDLYDSTGRHHLPYGWAGELTCVNTMGFEKHYQLYIDMVEHIKSCVKNPEQNVVWNKIGDCIYVMFRKKKDMMWFKLRFGI